MASDPIWSQLIPILDGGWVQLITIHDWLQLIPWLQLIVIDWKWLQLMEHCMGLIAHDWKYSGPYLFTIKIILTIQGIVQAVELDLESSVEIGIKNIPKENL